MTITPARFRHLAPLCVFALASLAPQARAQTWYPGASSTAVLAFEDQWPYSTDYDYNDVVLEVHWRFDRSDTLVQRALLTIDPVALGGELTHGLGLQLPLGTDVEGLVVRRRVGAGGTAEAVPIYGAWSDLSPTSESAPTFVLASNLRTLFSLEAGRLNVGLTDKGGRVGDRVEVELSWPVGAQLDTAQAPFDLFVFRTEAPSHEVHFPWYDGTEAMDTGLFAVAGNVAGKWFVNDRGIPAALNLQSAPVYPTEATRIETVFPDILGFAALSDFRSWSGSDPAQDPRTFYARPNGPGSRQTRSSTRLRPEPPAITREDCALSGNRVGKRVRSTSACVFSGCALGYQRQGNACVDPSISVSLAASTIPAGVRNTAYAPFDFKPLLSIVNDPAPDASLSTWAVTSGALPAGLGLNGATGVLSGTPTVTGVGVTFTITATYKGVQAQRAYSLAVESEVLTATRISAGATHSCAVTTTGRARCWGRNDKGQLGDGTTIDRNVPVDVTGLTSGVTDISAGSELTCAVANGGLWCWGENRYGRLGVGQGSGALTGSNVPLAVSGLSSGVSRVAVGFDHVCALTTGGALLCWGFNGQGQVGTGFVGASFDTPQGVVNMGSDVLAVTAGFVHTCAIKAPAVGFCWGNNSYGQVGDGTNWNNRPNPTQAFNPVGSLVAGASHTCAVSPTGEARCWGNNSSGELGIGNFTQTLFKLAPSGLGAAGSVQSIGAAEQHSCAVTAAGGLKCWGSNGSSRLGNPVSSWSTVPVDVALLSSGVSAVELGSQHTCALLTSGEARCWGSNAYGQVGNGGGPDEVTQPAAVLR
jgi:LruC domain-containing protein